VKHGREKAITFGRSGTLVGIVTEAAPGTDSAGRPAFIMLNSGILHRIGSCRLHVQLARALSAAGFMSLRFDYSGVGDSDSRRDTLPFEQSAVVETQEAMDYLTRTKGIQRFVLMGLCSGADMSHDTAVVDERVTGLMLIDGWVHRTVGHYVRHYAPRIFRLGVWRNSVRIRWQMLRGGYRSRFAPPAPTEGVSYEIPTYLRVFPPRERLARDFRAFVERRVAMYCIWTGGLPEYNYEGQFAAAFSDAKFGSLLREEYMPDANHILTGLHHQKRVVSNAVSWATATYASAQRAGQASSAALVESA
jgi:hypothetical protein